MASELKQYGRPERALAGLRDHMTALQLRPDATRAIEAEVLRLWQAAAPLVVRPDKGGHGALIRCWPRPPSPSKTVQAAMVVMRRCPHSGELISGMSEVRSPPRDARDAMRIVDATIAQSQLLQRRYGLEMDEGRARASARYLRTPEFFPLTILSRGSLGQSWTARHIFSSTKPHRFNPVEAVEDMFRKVVEDRLRRHGTIRLPFGVWLEHIPADDYRRNPLIELHTRQGRSFLIEVASDWVLPPPCAPHRVPAFTADEKAPSNTPEMPYVPRGADIALPCHVDTIKSVARLLSQSILARAFISDLDDACTAAWQDFSTEFDQDCLRIAQATHARDDGVLYGWLQAAGDARRSAVRKQACEAYPFLIPWLLDKPQAQAAINEAIDQELGLELVLAEVTKLSPLAVRSLQGVGWGDKDDITFGHHLESLLDRVGKGLVLPESHIPVRGAIPLQEQWQGLVRMVNLLSNLELGSYDLPSPMSAPQPQHLVLLNAEAPIWKTKVGLARIERWQQDHVYPQDALSAMASQLLLPLLRDLGMEQGLEDSDRFALDHQDRCKDIAWKLLGGPGSFGRLVETSRRWHLRSRDIAASLASADPRVWPALLPEPVTIGTHVLRSLTTSIELGEEGAAMDHCVASYVNACCYSNSHIVSVTTPAGVRVSTIEYLVAPDGAGGVSINQHNAHRNRPPPQEALDAGLQCLEMMRSGEIPCDLDGLRLALEERGAQQSRGYMLNTVGYDPLDPVGRDKALMAWRSLLPTHLQEGHSHSEWAERHRVMNLIRAACPEAPYTEPQTAPRAA